MANYFIFMPGGDDAVKTRFPDTHYHISEGLWAVASRLRTSADVCEQLGISGGLRGIVVPMEEYYGHYDRALWQKLAAWSASS